MSENTNTENCKIWLENESPDHSAVAVKLKAVEDHISKYGEGHPKYDDFVGVQMVIEEYMADLESKSAPDNAAQASAPAESNAYVAETLKPAELAPSKPASIDDCFLGAEASSDIGHFSNQEDRLAKFKKLQELVGTKNVVTNRKIFAQPEVPAEEVGTEEDNA